MILSDKDIRITVNKISDAEILDTHIVYDPENFKEEEFKCILLIEIKGKTFEKAVALYCSSIGNHERCSALHDGKLFIVMFNTAYMIHCTTGEIQYLQFDGIDSSCRINGKNVELTDFLGNRYTVSLLSGKKI